MNNKKEVIIAGIQKANDEYKVWLDQAKLLVKGNANHIVKDPVECTECEFGTWLYSDGQQLSTLPGFKEIESAHKAFYQAYASIYEGAKEVSDYESIRALKRDYSLLENQSAFLMSKLEQMELFLSEEDGLSDKKENTVNNGSEIEVEAEIEAEKSEVVSAQYPNSGSVNLVRQLKEQDLLQLQQEQQLTEMELNQLDERQSLTKQGTEQIAQYHSLKEEEINQKLNEHKILEESNINNIFLGQQDLTRIREEILSKQDELEQLALVDKKLEQRKIEEEEKERKILNDFKSRQSLVEEDLIQLGQQRVIWESEVEKLKQQLVLIEQDLEGLTEKESLKQDIIDNLNSEKEAKLEELMQQSQLQDKLNGHKIRVKESKKTELKQLEEEQLSKKKRLKELEMESAALENQKIDINTQHKKELRELEERKRFKVMTLEKLEKDKNRKNQELKELAHQQAAIQRDLDQMDSPKNDTKKELEEV